MKDQETKRGVKSRGLQGWEFLALSLPLIVEKLAYHTRALSCCDTEYTAIGRATKCAFTSFFILYSCLQLCTYTFLEDKHNSSLEQLSLTASEILRLGCDPFIEEPLLSGYVETKTARMDPPHLPRATKPQSNRHLP